MLVLTRKCSLNRNGRGGFCGREIEMVGSGLGELGRGWLRGFTSV